MNERTNIGDLLHRHLTVEIYDELISTSLTAKEYGEAGVLSDMLIMARRQSGGRGRLGRSFFSPFGGLYMSFLLHPKISTEQVVHITTAAAVAVCRAIEAESGKRCLIKWVNDIYIDGRKVSGILTESKITPNGSIEYAVLGIGVNLIPPVSGFPEDIKNRAGAVFDDLPEGAYERLAAGIVNEFLAIYDQGLNVSDYLDEYRERSFLIGKIVNVMRIHDGESREATAIAVDDDCSLVVRFTDGTITAVSSGEVSVRE